MNADAEVHRHPEGTEEAVRNCPDEIELHRPFVDQVTITCPECGKQMHRVPEVIDCWFDSGAMPFAQHHYPFENKELFEEQFPADFISEAVDQTRGWFYSLLAISTLLFDKAPYKNVIVLGHVQDENGQKMSKSKGNAVDPDGSARKIRRRRHPLVFLHQLRSLAAEPLPRQGRYRGTAQVHGHPVEHLCVLRAVRGYRPVRSHEVYAGVRQAVRSWTSGCSPAEYHRDQEVDRSWSYTDPGGGTALQDFVDELSNWYVRRCRERFWAKGMEQDKINAYMTLYTTLVTVAKLAAPMVPFMTEEIYQNLVRSVDQTAPESIHLCDYPTVNEAWIDTELEEDMDRS